MFPRSCHILEAVTGSTCFICYFQFHWKAEYIWSRDKPELIFYQVTLQYVQSLLRNRWKCIKQEVRRGSFVTFLSALGQVHNISYSVTGQRFIYLSILFQEVNFIRCHKIRIKQVDMNLLKLPREKHLIITVNLKLRDFLAQSSFLCGL